MGDDQFREHFPVTNRWSYLNHAYVGPLTREARDAVAEYVEDAASNAEASIDRWLTKVGGARRQAAQLLGCRAGDVAILKNTSEALATVAEGCCWQRGDNIVLVEGEYPANVYPWIHQQEKGVEVRFVPWRESTLGASDLLQYIDRRTRLVALSFVQFTTGFRHELRAIGKVCRDRNIDFCVDAIQGLGVLPMDVKRMKIDYLAAGVHKWLTSPMGASILYIDESKVESIRPTSVGWKNVIGALDFDTIDYRLQRDARRFECGTLAIPSIVGLEASLALINRIGIEVICDRVKTITDYLVDGLEALGARVISLRGEDRWSGIVSFAIDDEDPDEVVARCRNADVIICVRGGQLRASPHFYNNREDIDRLLAVLGRSS